MTKSNKYRLPLAILGVISFVFALTFFLPQDLKAGRKLIPVPGQRGKAANKTDENEPASPSARASQGVVSEMLRGKKRPQPKPDTAEVKLNHLNAKWDKVCRELAEKTGSTLVMTSYPRGRYSRRDKNVYNRTQAIRVLNEELEPLGYRIKEQGKFLVVMNVSEFRTRYRRPKVTREEYKANKSTRKTERNDPKFVRRFDTIHPHNNKTVQAANNNEQRRSNGRRIQQVSHEELRFNEPKQQLSHFSKHVPAVKLARKVYKAYGDRAKLIQKGPNGLPAFQVVDAKPISKAAATNRQRLPSAAFVVGIDAAENQLVVEAPVTQAKSFIQLVRALDDVPPTPNDTVSVVATKHRASGIAAEVRRSLSQISKKGNVPQPSFSRELRHQDTLSWLDEDPVASSNQSTKDTSKKRSETNTEDGDTDLDDIGGIQGNVRFESIDDSGVIIIRGNKKDVEAAKKILREIERLGLTGIPDVHLHELQHVNSQAISTLLNDVYTKLNQARRRDTETSSQVGFVAVVKPNALLVIASKEELKDVLQLVEKMDQPVDPDSEIKVIELKNASAGEVANLVNQYYADPQGLDTRLKIYADLRTNSVVVRARPRDLEEITQLINKIDRDESNAVSRLRVVPLKNAFADELAQLINQAILSLGGSSDSSAPTSAPTTAPSGDGSSAPTISASRVAETKSIVLELFSDDGSPKELVRSGILADVRISADMRTNTLLVFASEQSLPAMIALIEQLDQPTSAVATIKHFQLENADAATMVELLQGLFNSNQTNGNQNGPSSSTGPAGTEADLVPMKFSVDSRTNSIIASGGAESLAVVEAILYRLDESDVRQRKTEVIKLQNTGVEAVALAINDFLTSQRELAAVDPELISNTELLEKEIIAVPEPETNSLLISVTPRYYKEIRDMVSRLDEAPPQVIIQALLVEVELQNTDELGVELGFQDTTLFERSLSSLEELTRIPLTTTSPLGVQTTTEQIISQSSTPGFLFNNPSIPLGNNITGNPSELATQGLSNFSLGRANGELGYGGLVVSASSASVNVLIRALAAQRTVHILSRPTIRTLDNQEAEIKVGQNVPIVDGVIQGAFTTVPDIIRDDAGIILAVRPRVRHDGVIMLETFAQKSQYTGEGVPVFTDIATGNVVTSPIKDLSEVSTVVAVPSGQTVILGGMITKTDDTLERKVPWLGDVPYLGTAFRYDSTTTRRTELLVFLTPRIIGSDADSELINQVESERMHYIVEEAEAMHGPIFGVSDEVYTEDGSGQMLPETDEYHLLDPIPESSDGKTPTTEMPSNDQVVPPAPGKQPNYPADTGAGLKVPNSTTQQVSNTTSTSKLKSPRLLKLALPGSKK